MSNQHKGNGDWNWNWNWNWEWDKHSDEHRQAHRKRRRVKNFWPWFFIGLLCGRDLLRAAAGILRSLTRGFSSGISALISALTSGFRVHSATAVFGGLVVGVIIGLYVYKHKFSRTPSAADEEETAEEKEPAQADPVPIPMTLGNTPSSSDEEFIPQIYNTFGN